MRLFGQSAEAKCLPLFPHLLYYSSFSSFPSPPLSSSPMPSPPNTILSTTTAALAPPLTTTETPSLSPSSSLKARGRESFPLTRGSLGGETLVSQMGQLCMYVYSIHLLLHFFHSVMSLFLSILFFEGHVCMTLYFLLIWWKNLYGFCSFGSNCENAG